MKVGVQGAQKLGWPLKPFDKYFCIGSPIKAIRENIKNPRGLPRKGGMKVGGLV